jgi:hypothetical protein
MAKGPGRRPAVTIDGGRQLRRALQEIEHGVESLKDIHFDMAQVVANRAKQLAPVKTASRVRAGYKRIGNYAGVTHFGTPSGMFRRGQQPQPFLYQALEDEARTVFNMYDENLQNIIKKGLRYTRNVQAE